MYYNDPKLLAEEKRHKRISAATTTGIVILFLLIAFIWSGIRSIVPPPGEEQWESVGSVDFGDYKMGSKKVNNMEKSVKDPAPEPVKQEAAPKQAESKPTPPKPTPKPPASKPDPVKTQSTPSPVKTKTDLPKPKPTPKPKPKPTPKPTPKPKPTPSKDDGKGDASSTSTGTKPSKDDKQSGSNQGSSDNQTGNAGTNTTKLDPRYSFEWGSGGGGARNPLHAPYPAYSVQEEGILSFELTVAADGRVKFIKPVGIITQIQLKRASMAKLRTWKFPKKAGAADQKIKVTITFKLKG